MVTRIFTRVTMTFAIQSGILWHVPPREAETFIHPTAEVSEQAVVGAGTRIWHQAQVLGDSAIGRQCILGKGSFLDSAHVGDLVKVGNYANLFGAQVEDEAFIGPLVCIMEDPSPRSVNPDGSQRRSEDFERRPATVRKGASIGGGALIFPGVVVGAWSMVSAGSVVNRDVPPHCVVAGNPARSVGWACVCGRRLDAGLRCECGLQYVDDGEGLRLDETG